jgi:hypothetical protein
MLLAMTYPSKVFAAYGIIEWGLSDVRVTAPSSFLANSNGKQVEFICVICSHDNFKIQVPSRKPNTFSLVLIDNKLGDNFIVLDNNDLIKHAGDTITFEELAPIIKRKAKFGIEKLDS